MRACICLVLVTTACAWLGYRGGPPSLGLSDRETFAHYLASLPVHLKMRHQVETRFGPHREVVEGFCVLERPSRFWVRASSPLGGTLFDIKATNDGHVELDTPIDTIADTQGPFYMARDIQRIYLQDCPADAHLVTTRDGFRAICNITTLGPSIHNEGGPDLPDDAMTLSMSTGGIVWKKEFYRGETLTAVVHYEDYRQVGDRWLAHRITLDSRGIPYTFTVVLLNADLNFDTSRVFLPPAPP